MSALLIETSSPRPRNSSSHRTRLWPKECDFIVPILLGMYNEQSEHLFCRFSDAFIKYRQVVVEWMIDVADYFCLHITTTHAAIAYLDRLQPNEKFSRLEWQILAICCIIIAAKYNECEEHVPSLKRIEEITQQSISNDIFLNYELWALKKMSWKLSARTPSAFLCAQLELNLLRPNERAGGQYANLPFEELQQQFKDKMFALSTKCMVDLRFKGIQASAIAAAIIYHTRTYFEFPTVWTEELSRLAQHDPTTSRSARKALDLLFEMEETATPEHEVSMLTDLLDDVHFQEVASPAVTPQKEHHHHNENVVVASELATPQVVKNSDAGDSNEMFSPVSVNCSDL